ncbi:hypothetical protein RHMOL_Rhmol07G0020600 [Rhododendron molle]|uniref:Uncharacterized protein n=1 Tax=Rhododendron molle TaxID=49168 RepID=A0ACC0MXZ3_RHOML|nr:hypothetical protein RHMOL_Rhmol07G0020600 [Rhododendron molle]
MDFACSLQQSNLFHSTGVSTNWTSDSFYSHSKFRYRDLGCNFLGRQRLVSKAYRRKKLKRIILSTTNSTIHPITLVKGEFESHLWGFNSLGSLTCDFVNVFKASRGVVRLRSQGNDSIANVDGNGRRVEFDDREDTSISPKLNDSGEEAADGEVKEGPTLDDLRDLLQKAIKELELARLNSNMFEEKAQRISEAAIALKDEAENALDNVYSTRHSIQEIGNEEAVVKEAVQKATIALSFSEANLHVAMEALETAKRINDSLQALSEGDLKYECGQEETGILEKEEEALSVAQDEIKKCRATLENSEEELRTLQSRKEELQKELDRLNDVAEKAEMDALRADEEVANVMLLAEQAVAFELEAAQRVSDVEITLSRAEKDLVVPHFDVTETAVHQNESSFGGQVLDVEEEFVEDRKVSLGNTVDMAVESDRVMQIESTPSVTEPLTVCQFDGPGQSIADTSTSYDFGHGNGELNSESSKDTKIESQNSKNLAQTIEHELQKDLTKDSALFSAPKRLLKKSSRFFSASFFSSDGTQFTPASLFHDLIQSAREQLPKLVVGSILIGAGIAFYVNRSERIGQLFLQPDIITTSIDEVSSNAKPLVNEEEASLFDMLWLLLASVIFVPMFQKIPGGSPVLGYLAAGILIGPYAITLDIQSADNKSKHYILIVQLSVERLSSMKKYVFGLGSAQVLVTAVMVGIVARYIVGQPGPAALVIGNGLALSSTAVVLQVLQERGDSTSRHGRATFSVLLFQARRCLVEAVLGVSAPAALLGAVGFMLNGLAATSYAAYGDVWKLGYRFFQSFVRAESAVSWRPLVGSGGSWVSRRCRRLGRDLVTSVFSVLDAKLPQFIVHKVGFLAIAEALGAAAVKAAVAITAIIAGGRLLLRPIYKQVAENQNAEIFSANTLLVILGTSLLTARAGLSMALGAFLAGLLLAETEFSLQVESDIAPYRGLLLGLFFMTVGMSIDPKLLVAHFPVIMGTLALLIGGKTILVVGLGRFFGISLISAIRVGLLLAPGGEFAFVAFGEAVNQGIMSPQMSSLLFLVVGISMALTPWLAAGGQLIASRFEQHDVRSLLPVESETDDLQDHIIICGFGRVGQIIAQLLSERLIPFVALDVRSDRVAVGRALDLPVYFGDSGSREVLHKVGAERACAAAITLDTPGANYRTVWALSKYFPNVKTFVRAHDVDHGLNLEKAGATAVVPETLEPSLQLAAAVLAQAKLPMSEIAATINDYRSRHLSELTELCEISGGSLGYGYSRVMIKPKAQPSDSSEENQTTEGTLAI